MRTLSAEGELSGYVLAALPVGLFLYMLVANREYVSFFWTNPIGWSPSGALAILFILGFIWMRKLVQDRGLMDNLIPLLAARRRLRRRSSTWASWSSVAGRRGSSAARLALVAGYASDDPHSALVRAEQQDSLIRSSVVWLGGRLVTPGARRRIERQSLYAGRNDPAAVEDVVIRKVVYLVCGAVFGLLIGMLLRGPVVAGDARVGALSRSSCPTS